jgi:hypothetical protein
MSIADCADPVDDVERSDHQQQDRREYDSTRTSHLGLLSIAGRP